jgi:polyphosphate kinase 2
MNHSKSGKNGKSHTLGKSEFYDKLAPLQLELNDVARWLQHTGKRLVVVLEGRDTAGKGGVITSMAETLNPRQFRIVALAKPSDREQTQWYFQRYVPHLPAAGEIVFFDRSWYNRAGVERVMGFCSDEEARAFLKQAPVFEQMLVDDGILLFKYWLTVDQAEQEERFAERLADPLKRWKLSPIDVHAREKYAQYGLARDAMLKATHTPVSPWTPAAGPAHADPPPARSHPGAPGPRDSDRVRATWPCAAARAVRHAAQAHRVSGLTASELAQQHRGRAHARMSDDFWPCAAATRAGPARRTMSLRCRSHPNPDSA